MITRLFPLLGLLLCLAGAPAFAVSAQFILTFSGNPDTSGGFKEPKAVCFGADNNLFITDAGTSSVLKYSPEGRFLGEAGGAGSGNGRFDLPAGITPRMGFGLFICDAHNRRLVQLNEDLSVISSLSLDNRTLDGAFAPFAVAASREGTLYTADSRNGEVLALEKDDRIYPVMGRGKAQPLVALAPRSMAVLTHLYLDDARSGRIYMFDRFGTLLKSFGQNLAIADNGLVAWNDTLLAAADANRQQIIFFAENGTETGAFSTFDGSGGFSPHGFCARAGLVAILKKSPPAVVIMRVRF